MAPPQRPAPRQPRRSVLPAERSEEFAAIQRRLKAEAAERRAAAAARRDAPSKRGT